MVSRGRAEHYSSHPLMAGIPSIYIQRIAVRILDARRFAKILLVADLLGRIPIHQHPTILTGEPLRVTLSLWTSPLYEPFSRFYGRDIRSIGSIDVGLSTYEGISNTLTSAAVTG